MEKLKKGLGFVSQSRRGNQKLKVDGSGGLHSTVEADNEDAHEQSMTVTDALDELQSRIDSFQTEVDICAQERLGRVEAGIGDVKKGLVFMSKQAAFDYEQARLLQQKKEVASIRSRQKTNGSISTKWSKRLKGIGICDPASDIKDCLEHLEKLDHDDKNISQYILHSEELNSWLKEAQSNVIEINLHTPPSSLSNPLSFNSALFAETLRSTNQFPVLAFFSMHRNNESISQEVSGPVALVRSLNGQLLKFIAAHRPSVDLSALKDQGLFLEAKKSLRHGLRLLKGLILSLPENDALFLIIDTLSWLTGTECDQDKVFKKLGKIVEETENVVLKIMVTGTLPGSYAKSIADISLFVHDVSSGFGGIDIAESGGQIYKRIKGRHVKQGIGDAATMTEDDDGEEDSDED
ncbi:hypothetical protein SLS62_008432 [Diatrype stigma]|uniref:Uncharacterized protein n=1 Tax=Diatrype stigma TaxID=117547 RepID=A0AAN9UT87_9PEZI